MFIEKDVVITSFVELFYEFAMQYYKNHALRVSKLTSENGGNVRDDDGDYDAQATIARRHFKCGYYHEVVLEYSNALTCYRACHTAALDNYSASGYESIVMAEYAALKVCDILHCIYI